MKTYKYTGTGNNGTIAWALQRISGIVLIFALGYHLYGKVMSKVNDEAIIDGSSNSFLMASLAFFVTFHAFNGFKMVTDDYIQSKGLRFIMYTIYWTLGLICLKFALGMA